MSWGEIGAVAGGIVLGVAVGAVLAPVLGPVVAGLAGGAAGNLFEYAVGGRARGEDLNWKDALGAVALGATVDGVLMGAGKVFKLAVMGAQALGRGAVAAGRAAVRGGRKLGARFRGIVAPYTPAFRGQPHAFGRGVRSERALNLLNEAAEATGVKLSDYVDDVLYDAAKSTPYFWVTDSGRRQIVVGADTFYKTRTGQLIAGVHELEHVLQFDDILKYKGGDLMAARRAFFVSDQTNRYAIREIFTASIARERVITYLGLITPQQYADCTKYIRFFERRLRLV